ncbi:putative metallopeptidase [Acetonema longum]|uniref:Putative phage metallopeptidase domain-containing protein n=1 Tax=Acetonema longum DSM 6540 TaxID=1009370 RepID=F7NK76_9FIRM|nr:putative metallopeptidase [Acetonema longum]EGO63517.1 hypothetical protein ALO_12446 [Acetonema longum DSM 6540]
MYVEGDRVIVPVKGRIVTRRSKTEMEVDEKKRFDISLEVPGHDGYLEKDYNTEEIQCYDCEISEELRQLGDRVISKRPELFYIDEYIGRENICYVLSYEPKIDRKTGGVVFADCRMVTGPFRALMDYRYIVTFYDPHVQDLTENQKKVLMLHELLHIKDDGKIRPHDIEDFSMILRQYGLDWNDPYRTIDIPDILSEYGGGDDDAGKANEKKPGKKKTKNR